MTPTLKKIIIARATQLRITGNDYFQTIDVICREVAEVENGGDNPLVSLAASMAGISKAGISAEVGGLIKELLALLNFWLAGHREARSKREKVRENVEPLVSTVFETPLDKLVEQGADDQMPASCHLKAQ